MNITIDWPTGIIFVQRSELTSLGGNLYELDVNELRLALKDIEDSEAGSVWPDTHKHTSESLLSGVTYSRQLEILSPYTITFEDVGVPYTITCVGANHNLADVKNVNQVSLIIGNSAGLITVATGSAPAGPTAEEIADAVWGRDKSTLTDTTTIGGYISKVLLSIPKFLGLK